MNRPASGERISYAWLGNAVVLGVLLSLAAAAWLWQSAMPQLTDAPTRWWLAAATLASYAIVCIALAVARRRVRQPDAADDALPVIFASQTGFAAQLALQTVDTLRLAGMPTRLLALGDLDARQLQGFGHVLFIVSTTGEGDAPDSAAGFERRVLSRALPLPDLRYGVLALGDREYAQFCGFGHRLDAWLRHQRALPLFDLVEVDNGDDGALRHWQHHLGHLSGNTDLPDWQTPQYRPWRLRERRELNPGSVGGAVFHVALTPEDPADLHWQAGDIAEIGPRHAPATVARLLDDAGLDGARVATANGSSDTLATWLSRSQLPAAADIAGLPPHAIVAALVPLPHREYSIASLPADGALHLLIRQLRRPDGTLGLGAGWLTEYAAPGTQIGVRLRSNPGFHPPPDARPLLLIGNGTGIAGLRALLKARIAAGHRRNWLLFGERQRARDLFYGDELERWERDGDIEHLDLVFSRDQPQRIYVQQRLRERAERVRTWVAQGAAIHVCGSLDGMAGGVDAALRDILGVSTLETLTDAGRYRRDVY